MKKRFSAFLLAALMVAALLPTMSFAATVEVDPSTVQAALDAAVDGTTIKLTAGDYGILYLRKNDDSELIVNDGNWAGGGHTYKTTFRNLTIEGGEGVTVKGIRAEAGTYTRDGNQHSNSSEEAFLNSYIIFENLKVKNITFTMDVATVAVELASAGQKVSINGLTIDGGNHTLTIKDIEAAGNGNRLFYDSLC